MNHILNSINSRLSHVNYGLGYEIYTFPLVSTTFSIFAVAIISIAILLLGVFVSHTGEFTRFLHRLGFVYLIYYLWLETSSVVFNKKADLPYGHSDALYDLSEIREEDSLFFRLFLIYSTIVVAIFFFGVTERFFLSKRGRIEFPILVFFLHFGGLSALRLHTFIDLLMALEMVTLASYVFVTFERQNRFSTYVGVQYFILGSLPSARLLLAFGRLYLEGGSVVIQDLDLVFNTTLTSFELIESECIFMFLSRAPFPFDLSNARYGDYDIPYGSIFGRFSLYGFNFHRDSLISSVNSVNALSIRAVSFLFFNMLFKLTAAPFHVWAPSVYGKAPTVSVTFLSIYSKVRVLFLLFKFLNTFLQAFSFFTQGFILISGVLSIFVGRIGAFSEKMLKRFFVYSSRGHVGFRLIGLSLTTLVGASAMFQYLAVYILSSFVRWFLLLTRGRTKNRLSQLTELNYTDPFLGLLFAFLVFSISGIPPLGGFFIKLDLLSALLESSHFFINYLVFFFTVASFFYYLRVIKIIFFHSLDTGLVNSTVGFYTANASEYPRNVGRLWIRVIVINFLVAYFFIVQKPLLAIQFEVLSSFCLLLEDAYTRLPYFENA